MSEEENRRIALQWIEYLTDSRYDELFALGAPDATWWISGRKEMSPYTGTYPYAEREQQMGEIFKEKKSSKITIRGITTEGDTVVVEASPRIEVQDGRVYENDVVLKFVIKDGKIQSLREYLDLFAVLKFIDAKV
ncbi:NTF2-like protein [Phlegmacium glaucopus]|nr:NTF2-like protein [Phlegmacium glaucopus]